MNSTQLKQMLAYLKQSKTISQTKTVDFCRCYRLSEIARRLRNVDHEIVPYYKCNSSSISTYARNELIKQVTA